MASLRAQKSPTRQLIKSPAEEEGQTQSDFRIQENSSLPLMHQNCIGMRLFVKIPLAQKSLVVEAKPHHTIQDIKSIVGRMFSMSVTNQIMIYSGKHLVDCKTLAFYTDVKEESMLEMFPCSIWLFVKTPTEEIVKLRVKVLFTVGNVKAMVGRRVGSSVNNQNLFYAGNKLEDSQTIACYNIKDESILALLSPEIQIFVKTWSGKTVTLDVQLSSTIKDVKSKLFDKCPVPLHLQSILFCGKRLEEERDLASYNVRMHSTLHMVVNHQSNVIRKELSEFGHALPVTTTVSKLKDMAKGKWKVAINKIEFQGEALQDQHALFYYQLGTESVVDFVL